MEAARPPIKRPCKIAGLLPIGPEYSGRLLEGAIARALERDDAELIDAAYVRDQDDPIKIAAAGFDGAIVWLRQNDDWAALLRDRGMVVVNASGDRSPQEVPNVLFDRASVVSRAVSYFSGLARPNLLFIGCAITPVNSLRARAEMFLKACTERGFHAKVLELGRDQGIDNRSRILSADQLRLLEDGLASLKTPASIWCEDDFVARAVCDHALHLGYLIPHDFAILGLGDYRISRMGRPTISTIPQPGQVIGQAALDRILKQLIDGTPCEGTLLVPAPPVVIRESTKTFGLHETCYHQVHSLIRKHACEGLTVKEILPTLPISQRTFSKRFHELFGTTPGAMIREIKLNRAKELLTQSSLSVKRIASLCGFEEPGKFSSFFKREAGKTPGEFRSVQQ